jgi:hypothetical protein
MKVGRWAAVGAALVTVGAIGAGCTSGGSGGGTDAVGSGASRAVEGGAGRAVARPAEVGGRSGREGVCRRRVYRGRDAHRP